MQMAVCRNIPQTRPVPRLVRPPVSIAVEETNEGQYGTGYCDAQCPQDLKFIAGKVRARVGSRPMGLHDLICF